MRSGENVCACVSIERILTPASFFSNELEIISTCQREGDRFIMKGEGRIQIGRRENFNYSSNGKHNAHRTHRQPSDASTSAIAPFSRKAAHFLDDFGFTTCPGLSNRRQLALRTNTAVMTWARIRDLRARIFFPHCVNSRITDLLAIPHDTGGVKERRDEVWRKKRNYFYKSYSTAYTPGTSPPRPARTLSLITSCLREQTSYSFAFCFPRSRSESVASMQEDVR